MKIPDGVNFKQFYDAAKAKGIKISSRYQGVVINIAIQGINWVAQYQTGGKKVFLGRFPFTMQGELDASNAYQHYLKENNIKPRFTVKRKYKS